ncbi:MAG: CCA tRNA nucleotidyltransferase [Rhodobiaceae bacterium]|nr:CCA tRNA nucleotidyltransferase [Rhodobiaceae bacterium]MCC0056381.1 CCA tRNA nucleotidyltransferase [Rhodobiaceae bacterium]
MARRTIALEEFRSEGLHRLMQLLNNDAAETRVVGGAVRNLLLGEPVSDIDLATTAHPQAVMERCAEAGLSTVPTGVEHGTVTVIVDGAPFEVTTLREDVETDGRRAVVAFGNDWNADAMRRDFTINALYVDASGRLHDPVGGLADIDRRAVRFIGDAEQRIREDYLRILRFFRFHARYGKGRPDATGLKAASKLKAGIARLSAERVWKELKLLFAAPEPVIAVRWMRVSGIMDAALPEQSRWGIDFLEPLIVAERIFGWQPDAMLRLMSIVPPRADVVGGLADRLKLSNDERERLRGFALAHDAAMQADAETIDRALYRYGASGIADNLRLLSAKRHYEDESEAHRLSHLVEHAEVWRRPVLPVAGRDLLQKGLKPGPAVGEALSRLEKAWLESGFRLTREELLAMI